MPDLLPLCIIKGYKRFVQRMPSEFLQQNAVILNRLVISMHNDLLLLTMTSLLTDAPLKVYVTAWFCLFCIWNLLVSLHVSLSGCLCARLHKNEAPDSLGTCRKVRKLRSSSGYMYLCAKYCYNWIPYGSKKLLGHSLQSICFCYMLYCLARWNVFKCDSYMSQASTNSQFLRTSKLITLGL